MGRILKVCYDATDFLELNNLNIINYIKHLNCCGFAIERLNKVRTFKFRKNGIIAGKE